MTEHVELGPFSVSLSVADLAASRAFHETLGFEEAGGAPIGLSHRAFEGSVVASNPPDVRALRRRAAGRGIEAGLLHEMPDSEDPAAARPATDDEGPAHLVLRDPDGNALLFDQF